MMTKQHYQQFADMIASIKEDALREEFINKCSEVFKKDNNRFSKEIFMEWINRQMKGDSLKGLRPSKNYNRQ